MSKNYYIHEFKYRFAQEIKKLRIESGLSIEELSKTLNIKQAQLYALELGNHKDWDAVFNLARFMKKKVKVEFY